MYREIRDEEGNLTGVMKDGKISIPNNTANRDWRKYLEWLAEGNTPDPYQTPEEEAQSVIDNEIAELRRYMRKVVIGQFEMILEIFDVGRAKGLWKASDFDPNLVTKAQDWKQKIARLKELGDSGQ